MADDRENYLSTSFDWNFEQFALNIRATFTASP